MSRRTTITVSINVLATIFALIGLAFAVFGPMVFTYGTNMIAAGPMSPWTDGIDATVGVYQAVMVIAALGIHYSARCQAPSSDISVLQPIESRFLLR